MQKRIADLLEKASVGFMVGSFFQSSGWALVWSVTALVYCLVLTRRMEKNEL